MKLCPCGSVQNYEQCCGLYLDAHQAPETPEQLMRSRYTAFSLSNIHYIGQTMKGKALEGFDEQQVKQSITHCIWIGLEVVQAYQESPDKGFVEFKARFLERNQVKTIHELSEFHRMNNRWFYVDGTLPPSHIKNPNRLISRNTPCPCGSGKKFKNCHEK